MLKSGPCFLFGENGAQPLYLGYDVYLVSRSLDLTSNDSVGAPSASEHHSRRSFSCFAPFNMGKMSI